jgi:hypothetical protein
VDNGSRSAQTLLPVNLAATLGITERGAAGIVTDLTTGGYLAKEKDGRRNRYQIEAHLPLREAITQKRTI